MPNYSVTLKDRTVETVEGVDAYQQEGQMTTFFATRQGRDAIDCWSTRVASFRTSELVIIRRVHEQPSDEHWGDVEAPPVEPAAGRRLRSA